MKSALTAIAFLFSLISLTLGLLLWNHLGRPMRFEGSSRGGNFGSVLADGANSPKGVVEIVMRVRTASKPLGLGDAGLLDPAYRAYFRFHKDEIFKTLEVVETSESGDYGIAFYRYSIGTNIVRRAIWCGKVNGEWYWVPYTIDGYDKPTDEEWYEKMMEKKGEWEKGSVEKFL